ncbi:unnamed protein product [Symbiodinium necroappetens]|uniref:Uncharacterized protein n=1 Tax=Symbiodinium necroappetens TaxID=1628268 RepID=A0A812VWX4_9DINO|nr:unnamed protein product [Symbiodinium necroappetens]
MEGCCPGHAACTSLADLQSCLVQFKTELLQFRELRLRRQSSFRNFLEEAAVVAADKPVAPPLEQIDAISAELTASAGPLEARRQEDEDSDLETDPGMPELQPVTPREIAEVPSSQPACGDFSPVSPGGDDSPDRLGDSSGDFNKCWGRSALKDALKGMSSLRDA